MRVLVLGGNGFIGRSVVRCLLDTDWAEPVVASRFALQSATKDGVTTISVDSKDEDRLTGALAGVDAVVNCVAGDGSSISAGAGSLVNAALAARQPRIVHLSTESVYGCAEGRVNESFPLRDDLGWYGHAKILAEKHMQRYYAAGGALVILRPGCVIGSGSEAWVGRIARWLVAGRLGDLGPWGDGPANLVDVDDVARACVLALRHPCSGTNIPIFNLAMPDSPRWNDYFSDLALALGAIPLKRMGKGLLQFEAYIKGIPLKLMERVLSRMKLPTQHLSPGIPPSLLALWRQQLWLDGSAATRELGMTWSSYADSLRISTEWAIKSGYASRGVRQA